LGPSSGSRLARVSTERNGEVDLLWNPNVTGNDLSQVNALAVTGSYLYFAGSFDRVGGLTRKNIARVSLDGTGAPDPYWDASTDGGTMYALAANGEEIYAGGWFSQIGGQPRRCLAKLTETGSGIPDPTWLADTEGWPVTALTVSGNSILAGGDFGAIDGQACSALAKLRVATGAPDSPVAPPMQYAGSLISLNLGGGLSLLCATRAHH